MGCSLFPAGHGITFAVVYPRGAVPVEKSCYDPPVIVLIQIFYLFTPPRIGPWKKGVGGQKTFLLTEKLEMIKFKAACCPISDIVSLRAFHLEAKSKITNTNEPFFKEYD